MTPSGIETATFQLGEQCLKQLRHRVPQQISLWPLFCTGGGGADDVRVTADIPIMRSLCTSVYENIYGSWPESDVLY
jgi:hypothetical protein